MRAAPSTALISSRERGSRARPAGEVDRLTLPARTVLVAAGTTPNMTYEKEAPATFELDAKKKFFQPHRVGETERRLRAGARS